MDNTFKRLLSLAIALVMIISMMPVSAPQVSAAETDDSTAVVEETVSEETTSEETTPAETTPAEPSSTVVTDEAGLIAAVANGGTIALGADITLTATLEIAGDVTITDDGTARTITRGSDLTGVMFNVNGNLTLAATSVNKLAVDGSSVSATKPAVLVNAGGTANVNGVVFTNLVSTGSAAAFNVAGAENNKATVTIIGASFTDNTGTTGGAVYFGNYSAATVENCVFTGNYASSYGGAFYCENYSAVHAIDSLFANNSGKNNGGAFMLATDGNNGYGLTLTGCTVAGNTAPYGGGLYAWKESGLTLDGTVFAGNTATTTAAGGDIHFRMNGTDAKEQLTVKTSGTDPVIADIYFQTGCLGKVYVVGQLASGSNVSYNWDSVKDSNNNFFNVTFDTADLAASNKDMVHLAESLSAGYELVYSENTATVTAYTPVVNTNVAKVGETEYATFAEAIAAAGTEGTVTLIADVTLDATVTIPEGTSITITDDGNTRKIIRGSKLTDSMFSVNGTLTLNATGAERLVIDGNGVSATASGISVNAGSTVNVNAGVKVCNMASSSNGGAFLASGTYANRATLNINGAIIADNSITSYGGAIWAQYVYLNINDALFAGNSAGNGGAIYCENYSINKVENTVFAGNSTTGSGGVFLLACDKNTAEGYGLTLKDCVLAGNSAANGGGIYAWKETSLTLDGCTVLGNSVTGTAAGKEVYFRMNGSNSKEVLILKATNSPLRTSIYTHSGMENGLLVQGTLHADSYIVLNWDAVVDYDKNPLNVTFDSAALAWNSLDHFTLAQSGALSGYSLKRTAGSNVYTLTNEQAGSVAKVGDTEYATLSAAVAAANALEDGATVTLLADVIVSSTINITGNVTITDDGNAHSIIRDTTDALFNVTGSLTLDGTGENTLVLDGNGDVFTGTASAAVLGESANVTVNSGVKFYNFNTSANGSIFSAGGNMSAALTIDGAVFDANKATGVGGVIAIWSTNTLNVSKSVFTNNNCPYGGVIYVNGANCTATVTGSTFEGNSGTAGGVFNVGSSAKVEISDSAFKSNETSARGGAIYIESSSSVTVSDTTFEGNKSTGNTGGAIFSRNKASIEAIGCTFTGNSASNGGAIMVDLQSGNGSTATVTNCTFTENTTTGKGGDVFVAANCTATLDDCSASDVYAASGSDTTLKATEQAASLNVLLADGAAKVSGALFENTAITLNWETLPTGTAVVFDSAELATAHAGNLALADALSADYKLYQLNGTNTCVVTSKYVATVDETKYETLAKAIEAANALENGGTVVLIADAYVDSTIEISGNVTITDDGNAHSIIRGTANTLFNVTGSLTLQGTAESMLTVDGANVASSTSGFIVTGGLSVQNVDLKDLNSGSYANGALFYLNKGPAVTFTNVSITGGSGQVFYIQGAASDGKAQSFVNCTFADRTGDAAGIVFNGASSSAVALDGCTFRNNSNNHRGVIYVEKSVYTITNCTFDANKSTGNSAGAICVTAHTSSVVNITDSTFTNNSATGHGGAIWARGGAASTVSITNSTFSGNTAGSLGDAIMADTGTQLILDGCTVADEIYVADATSVAPVIKATEAAITANMTVAKGYVKVAGQLAEGSALTLNWSTVPGGQAIIFDTPAAANENKDNIVLAEALTGYSLVYKNNAATLYNPSAVSQDVYVASTGSDDAAGTEEAPVLSLNKALELVKDGGTIHIVDSYTAASDFVWDIHNKDVTITGGKLDFSAVGTTFNQNDAVTYDNLTLIFADYSFYYANGNRLQINENVVNENVDLYVFGGSYYGTVYGTDINILAGNYFKIFGGSRFGDIIGDVNVYVGGNVNPDIDTSAHSGTFLYGGSANGKIDGKINLTFTGNAKVHQIYGGSEIKDDGNSHPVTGGVNSTISGGQAYSIYGGGWNRAADQQSDVNLTITGGTFAQVFGGDREGNLTGNVTVTITGGTITRRIYGGCYNEVDAGILSDTWATDYMVIGNVTVKIGGGANITLSSSDSDTSIYAHSRRKGAGASDAENSTLIFLDETAYNNYSGKLEAQDAAMKLVMSRADVTTAADSIIYNGETVVTYTVTYVADGETVAEYTVESGSSVTSVPAVPEKTGYTGAWDNEGTSITADTTITAIYTPNASVDQWSLTLGDDIGINFYANIADPENTTVSITVGGETTTVKASTVIPEDGCPYVFSADVAAAQMTDTITFVLTCGELTIEKTYTVRQYADTILNGEYSDAAKTLVKEMLNFGAMAQTYFGYNTENPANADLSGFGTADVSAAEIPAMSVSGSADGISYYGATLVFGSKTAVRFYFTGDITDCTFMAGETELTAVEKNGMWYVEIGEINPQDLNQEFTVSVNDTLRVTYSPLNYMARMYANSTNADLQALMQAMYNYHLAAVEYAKETSVA